ncbi:MAG TPA: YicC/YloC family endoribonuclease [Anaeromyxobacteraceae bacterium]|nr:YicC/YloC family endoribonuclease [Anaeromyxobacteraceae bacterium]
MTRSMTGFGSGRAGAAGEEIDAEVRSVNHKYCEVKVRLPRELAALEPELARLVKERLARGGVEVTLRRGAARGSQSPRVDLGLAVEYAKAFEEVRSRVGLAGPVSLESVLGAEGVVTLEERAVDVEAMRPGASEALQKALDALSTMREREGAALGRDLEGRLAVVESLVTRVEALSPRSVEVYRDRLAERVEELSRGLAPDPVRLATEVALFADRVDVSEEVTRLRSHLSQMRGLLFGDEPAGRKMDFLVQEMHREVNTIGSKSQSADIAASVVSLKAEVERMREQVQNVE